MHKLHTTTGFLCNVPGRNKSIHFANNEAIQSVTEAEIYGPKDHLRYRRQPPCGENPSRPCLLAWSCIHDLVLSVMTHPSWTEVRRVNHDSPSTPRAFSISGRISSTPGALPLWSCFDYLSDLPPGDWCWSPFILQLCLYHRGRSCQGSGVPQSVPSNALTLHQLRSTASHPYCTQLGWFPASPSWGVGQFSRTTLVPPESPFPWRQSPVVFSEML